MTGTLYGVGVGPGDPELITLKAARLIEAADVVAYHCARHGRSVARGIAAAHLRSDQVEEVLVYPVTTEATDHPGGYQGAIDEFYAEAARRLPPTSTPGATWCCSPRATRSSTAPTCTCTSGSPRTTAPRSCPVSRR